VINWYWLLLAGVILVAIFVAYRSRGMWREIQAERIRESFQLQHERLEAMFQEQALKNTSPRGLRWVSCPFTSDAVFTRMRTCRSLAALVGVTVTFEAIEGGDMEGLPAVPVPRSGSAVMFFRRGEWSTAGRVIFNLSPAEAVRLLPGEFEPIMSSSGS